MGSISALNRLETGPGISVETHGPTGSTPDGAHIDRIHLAAINLLWT